MYTKFVLQGYSKHLIYRVQMISTILTIGLTLSINFYDHTKKFTQHVNLTLIKAGVGKSMFSIASPRYEHKRVKEDLS